MSKIPSINKLNFLFLFFILKVLIKLACSKALSELNETQKNVLELANLIIKIMDSSPKLDVQGENNGEIKYQYLDSNKAKEILSWKPKFGLEKGLTKTISWYKSFFNNA